MSPVDEGIVAVALYEYEAAEEGELSAFSHARSLSRVTQFMMRLSKGC